MFVPDNAVAATGWFSVYVVLGNEEHQRFAVQYGATVISAWAAFRDKVVAESAVDLVERWVITPSSEMTHCRRPHALLRTAPADLEVSRHAARRQGRVVEPGWRC